MEVDIYRKINDPVSAMERMGKFIGESGMFGCSKAQQGMVLAMACLTERKSPLEILAKYHVFYDGKLGLKSEWTLAEFRRQGGKHKLIERSPDRAAVEITTKDGEIYTFSFSWAEAQKEPFPWTVDKQTKKPVLKTNWATPRARMQMLWWRVVSDALRSLCPEINSGFETDQERGDETNGERPAVSVITDAGKPAIDITAGEAATPGNGDKPKGDEPYQVGIGEDGLLNFGSVDHLTTAFGGPDRLADAEAYLIDIGFLNIGQRIQHLSPARAQRILNNPTGFREALNTARPAKEPQPDSSQGGAK